MPFKSIKRKAFRAPSKFSAFNKAWARAKGFRGVAGSAGETATAVSPAEPATPLNPLALAQALLKAENFEGALKAFRLIDLKGMKAEERCPIQYLTRSEERRVG